jgi:hypothetical protein
MPLYYACLCLLFLHIATYLLFCTIFSGDLILTKKCKGMNALYQHFSSFVVTETLLVCFCSFLLSSSACCLPHNYVYLLICACVLQPVLSVSMYVAFLAIYIYLTIKNSCRYSETFFSIAFQLSICVQ